MTAPVVAAKHLSHWRLTKVAVCLAMVALPLLRPVGPGNTGLVDLALLGAMTASGLWASIRAHRVQLPYALPVLLMAVAGAVAAMRASLVGEATLGLAGAPAAGWLFSLARRRGLGMALAVGVGLAAGGAVAYTTVDLNSVVAAFGEKSSFVRDSIGREQESGGSRTTLIKESVVLYLNSDNVWGLGPANTETTLKARQAAYVKEAHDDYVAALLERGVLGTVGLIVLGAAVAVRARRIAAPGGLPPRYLAVVPRPELLGAGLVAVGMSAL